MTAQIYSVADGINADNILANVKLQQFSAKAQPFMRRSRVCSMSEAAQIKVLTDHIFRNSHSESAKRASASLTIKVFRATVSMDLKAR